MITLVLEACGRPVSNLRYLHINLFCTKSKSSFQPLGLYPQSSTAIQAAATTGTTPALEFPHPTAAPVDSVDAGPAWVADVAASVEVVVAAVEVPVGLVPGQ